MNIGRVIKNEREEQKVSREELAQAIGKSIEFVAKVEGGTRNIGAQDLARVAHLLGRPLEFFTGEVEEPEAEREIEQLIESAKLDPRYGAELRRVPRLRTKQAIVELAKRLEARRFGIFRQLVHESETEVMLDSGREQWWHRRIQILDDELPELKLRYIQNLARQQSAHKDFDVSLLKERCNYDGGEMRIDNLRFHGNLVLFSVVFTPPVRRGEIVDVSCQEYVPDAVIMTGETLKNLANEREFLGDMVKEKLGFNVFVPTDFLRRRITFPRDYEINHIDAHVFVSRMRLRDEGERINKEKCLTKMKVGSRWVLELTVQQPVVGASYYICWQPPPEKDYKELLSGTTDPNANCNAPD